MTLRALAAAAKALDARDDDALIAALLDAWRATQHRAIATFVV